MRLHTLDLSIPMPLHGWQCDRWQRAHRPWYDTMSTSPVSTENDIYLRTTVSRLNASICLKDIIDQSINGTSPPPNNNEMLFGRATANLRAPPRRLQRTRRDPLTSRRVASHPLQFGWVFTCKTFTPDQLWLQLSILLLYQSMPSSSSSFFTWTFESFEILIESSKSFSDHIMDGKKIISHTVFCWSNPSPHLCVLNFVCQPHGRAGRSMTRTSSLVRLCRSSLARASMNPSRVN
jgi:hypothetical protein